MGVTYFVDAANGFDGNVGYDMDAPLRTVAMAVTKCVADNDDVIFVLSNGYPTVIDEAVVLNKDAITLMGENSRVEIRPTATGASSVTITSDRVNLRTLTIGVTSGGTDDAVSIVGSEASSLKDVRLVDATAYGLDIDAGCLDTHILENVSYLNNASGDVSDLGTDTYTLTTGAGPSAAAIADAVWDETINKSNHNNPQSAGKRLRQAGTIIAADGQVADMAATTTSFVTDLTSAVDSFYDDHTLVFTSGDLEGQARIIASYNATTKTLTFDEPFTSAPANTDEFSIFADHVHALAQIANAVWDEVASEHETDGTFGGILSPPGGLSRKL